MGRPFLKEKGIGWEEYRDAGCKCDRSTVAVINIGRSRCGVPDYFSLF